MQAVDNLDGSLLFLKRQTQRFPVPTVLYDVDVVMVTAQFPVTSLEGGTKSGSSSREPCM